MAKVNGRIYSCDRCGDKIFVKTIGEKEMDGGFTRYNTFEDMPEGWGYDCRVGMDLCPECKKELDSIIALYKDGNKNPLKTMLSDIIYASSIKKEVVSSGPDEDDELIFLYTVPDYKLDEIANRYGVTFEKR